MGTHAWGLALPSSTLNIQLIQKSKELTDEAKEELAFDFIARLEKDRSTVDQVLVESRASILLAKLKMTPAFGSQTVELIFRTTGGSHQPRSEELVRDLLEKHPTVRPVFLALKLLLAKNQIGDLGKGGLTSLSLLLLIVSVVQNQQIAASKLKVPSLAPEEAPAGLPVSKDSGLPEGTSPSNPVSKAPNPGAEVSPFPEPSPGKLLIDFLFWFGFRFNFSEFSVAISPSPETPTAVFVPRASKGSTLSVIHPCNPSIVTTKAFKHTEAFKEWCKLVLNSLYTSCACQSLRGPERHLGIPMIRFAHLKTQAVVSKASRDPALPRSPVDLTLRIQPEPRRPPVSEEVKSLSEVKVPRRRRLSSRSQTYEAKGDSLVAALDLPAPDGSAGYVFRKTLFCSSFNAPTSLKFVN